MKIAILDKATLGEDIDLSAIRALGETYEHQGTSPEEMTEHIGDADVIVVNKIKCNESTLENAKNLKLICVAATGYDNVDLEYCKSKGIGLCNVPGYSTDSVAQVTVAMAMNLATHIPEYTRFVSSGRYTMGGVANCLVPVFHEMSAMKWGVVGGGGIGTKVAEIARAIGCDVVVCRRKQEGDFPLADIDTLCRECDIISLHVPLSEKTRNLINRERIESMKQGAILVNTARGAVCDEKAVAEAARMGKIMFGCDVYSVEPFGKEHPFNEIMNLDNVCLSPHMAWGAFESRMRCVKIISDNIRCYFEGAAQNRIV
ncbi:MAG: hydroxyacid dehydrogenase [Clostridia bacterium]|nr:hydroxyacid dehydrogenase [Clostridia bacterium]